jgi:hypothetical protein
MTPSFQLSGIEHAPFAHLFELSDEALKQHGAVRQFATENPGYPCRVSLQDAEVGEELLLLPYEHQPAASPYRASGPIYVRRNAMRRVLEPGQVSGYVTRRLMSVRAYGADHMMVDASVCEGERVADEILRLFEDERVAYLHLHNAKRGCFSCRVERA